MENFLKINTHICTLIRDVRVYILHSIEIYRCSEKQTEAGKIAKIGDFSTVEKHLADILVPGLVTWTAMHQSDEVLTVSQSQSYNAHLLLSITPLHFIASLNKRSGAATSRRDCKAWPCNCLDHFHHKMAGLASHRHFKNIFGCNLLMKRGFYLKSGMDLHCDITHW